MKSGPSPDRKMLEALVCPVTNGPLSFDSDREELVSKNAKLAFPIRNGIPVMLIDEARPLGDDLPPPKDT
jgi:uncharacterized protein YbaR (Trm112 family)